MKKILASAFLFIWLCSCHELAKKVGGTAAREVRAEDSITFAHNEKPISIDNEQILKTFKRGEDSLVRVRQFFVTGEKYSDSWYKNGYRDSISNFYYKSGQMSQSIFYRDGAVLEVLGSFTPDGQKRSENQVKNGAGNLKIYHPITYRLIVDCNFKDGLKNGEYRTWYSNGNKHEFCIYKDESPVGEYTVWHVNGVVKLNRIFSPAKNTYSYNTFYDSGNPEACEVREGDSLVSMWKCDENGNMTASGVKVNGHMKGFKYYYFDEGKILMSRSATVDGKRHGDYEYFYKNGARKSVEVYVDDLISYETKWYESGEVQMKTAYKNGEYDGLYLEYYPNGKKRIEQEYAAGVKQGRYVSYFENGNKYYEGFFEHGKAKGEMKVYARSGELRSSKKYE